MTRQEVYQLMEVLQAYYTDNFRGLSDAAAQLKVALWQEAFQDEPGALVIAATKAYAITDTSGFMPKPGQIKEQIRLLQKEDELSEQGAWDLVLKALSNSSYGSVDEFARLPEPVKRAVGSHNVLRQWGSCNHNELQFVASEFKRAYRQIAAEQHNLEKIPTALKEIAGSVAKQLPEWR